MPNFADLEARVDRAVINSLMDDALYTPPVGEPVPTRAELFYRDDDSGAMQRSVQSIAMPVADVPRPLRDAALRVGVRLVDGEWVGGVSYKVVNEIERDAAFVRVTVRPVP